MSKNSDSQIDTYLRILHVSSMQNGQATDKPAPAKRGNCGRIGLLDRGMLGYGSEMVCYDCEPLTQGFH